MPFDSLGHFVRNHESPGKPVVFVHFTMNGFAGEDLQPRLPGVEKVILNQMRCLETTEYTPWLVVGATDCRQKGVIADPHFIVHRKLASGHYNLPKVYYDVSRYFHRDITVGREFFDSLTGVPFIIHNFTNAKRHNPVAGAAAREHALTDRSCPKIFWVHDFRGAGAQDLQAFLPDTGPEHIKIVCVSEACRQRLLQQFRFGNLENYLNPERVVVIPNPIYVRRFLQFHDLPKTIQELAPNLDDVSLRSQGLPLELLKENPTSLFAGNRVNTILVPARIVKQKNVLFAIKFAIELAKRTWRSRMNLVVTGPPDTRKPENAVYYEEAVRAAREVNERKEKLRVIFLLGIDEQYLSQIYRKSVLVLAPFENEGWGYVPPEAALAGVPVAIAPDEALMETSRGFCYVLGREKGYGRTTNPNPLAAVDRDDVRGVLAYAKSDKRKVDIKKLAEYTHDNYSMAATRKQLRELLRT